MNLRSLLNFFLKQGSLGESLKKSCSLAAFLPIQKCVKFWNYEDVANFHTKMSAAALIERAVFLRLYKVSCHYQNEM
jgi:hypothetical protein